MIWCFDWKDVVIVDELYVLVIKLVGFDDFGIDDDNYCEVLGVLLDVYQGEVGFIVLGSKMNWFFLCGVLVVRLLFQFVWKQYLEYVDVVIKWFIFVIGLVCIGIIVLYWLLGVDLVY